MVSVISRGVSYGYLPNMEDHMQLLAILLNYGLILFFYCRHRSESIKCVKHHAILLLVLLLTCCTYFMHPNFMGTSTVWAFMYGYVDSRNRIDHLVYFSCCLGVIVPFYLKIWPWAPVYLWICTMAHFISSLAGYQAGLIERAQSTIKKSDAIPLSAMSLARYEQKIIRGDMARHSAALFGHTILNDFHAIDTPIDVGSRHVNLWKCLKTDPDVPIPQKLWRLWGLDNFVHEESIEKNSRDTLKITDTFKWHLKDNKYRSRASQTYVLREDQAGISFAILDMNIRMDGLPFMIRKKAEAVMSDCFPTRKKTAMRAFLKT